MSFILADSVSSQLPWPLTTIYPQSASQLRNTNLAPINDRLHARTNPTRGLLQLQMGGTFLVVEVRIIPAPKDGL